MIAKGKKTQFIALTLAASMGLSLAGCSSDQSSSNTTEKRQKTNDAVSLETEFEFDMQTELIVEETEQQTEESAEDDYEDDMDLEEDDYDEENSLSSTQKNSINMLNYMTVLTQEINESAKNQLFLESAYSSLVNDIYPNAVDTRTEAQITSLMDTIENYRMIQVKRERLEYIYEQNKAQAMRQAIPDPMAILNIVTSGSVLKAAISVVYMAADSATSYAAASSQADQQFIQDGWELDDAEAEELHNSTKSALTYMFNMVRDNSLPGEYALNKESVEDFVSWTSNTNLVRAIAWLETNEKTYQQFGSYWLELAKDYYDTEDYKKCLGAIHKYESVTSRIFRKDQDYATALPIAILSAKETLPEQEYVETAEKYCKLIIDNTKDSDWSLRYFTAQIYLDLYAITENADYLSEAYDIAFNNVNVLLDVQRNLNDTYLAEVVEQEAGKDATKREKSEVKEYNKALKAERKIALPPVSEALYLNCDLLFALADEINISEKEQARIESIIHENGEPLFLAQSLDKKYWFDSGVEALDASDIEISFTGDKITLPAICVTDRSSITVTINHENEKTELTDWKVSEVERPKGEDYTGFTAVFESKKGSKYKYDAGDTVTISITPVEESPEETLEFTYNAVKDKKLVVLDDIEFERTQE